jgi:hypothetical protein
MTICSGQLPIKDVSGRPPDPGIDFAFEQVGAPVRRDRGINGVFELVPDSGAATNVRPSPHGGH